MITSVKTLQRNRIRRDIDAFLAKGGKITRVPAGYSGANPQVSIRGRAFLPAPPRLPRTEIPEVLQAIDTRKAVSRTPKTRTRHKVPRKRYIYDDFGDVIRWEWVP